MRTRSRTSSKKRGENLISSPLAGEGGCASPQASADGRGDSVAERASAQISGAAPPSVSPRAMARVDPPSPARGEDKDRRRARSPSRRQQLLHHGVGFG